MSLTLCTPTYTERVSAFAKPKDVYKRQVVDGTTVYRDLSAQSIIEDVEDSLRRLHTDHLDAVSYTHLDVYKRQGICCFRHPSAPVGTHGAEGGGQPLPQRQRR